MRKSVLAFQSPHNLSTVKFCVTLMSPRSLLCANRSPAANITSYISRTHASISRVIMCKIYSFRKKNPVDMIYQLRGQARTHARKKNKAVGCNFLITGMRSGAAPRPLSETSWHLHARVVLRARKLHPKMRTTTTRCNLRAGILFSPE